MLQPKAPGVYTREIDSGVRTIVGTPTSVALFVGPAAAGIDLRPQRITSFADYERLYGGLSQNSNMSYSLLHFYANGGGEAYVVRVPPNNSKPARTGFKAAGAGSRVAEVTALSSGLSGNTLLVEFDSFGLGLDLGGAAPTRFNLTIADRASGRGERFADLTTSAASARSAEAVIRDPDTGSQLVSLTLDTPNAAAPAWTGTILKLPDITKPGPANTFAKVCRLSVEVEVLDAAGAPQAALGFKLANITLFAAGEPRPASKLDLLNKTLSAINAAIAADDPARAKMNGLQIEGQLFEGGAYVRLRVGAPGGGGYDRRIYDATIRLAAPNPAPVAPEKSWLEDFTDAAFTPKIGPSRYQLGANYPTALIDTAMINGRAATDAGVDGDASGQPSEDAFLKAVQALGTVDPFFNTLCLPDLARAQADNPTTPFYPNAINIYGEAAQVCGRKYAFLVVDPPPSVINAGAALAWKSLQFTFQSSFAGAWFPNIRVDDPLVKGAIRSHPPSGAIAGMIARTDGEVGVWQAPAGTEASLNGVYGPAVLLSDDDHGLLNPVGVNCIRRFPVYGTVAFGSRTTDGADTMASDWKYIPVRRTSNYILRTMAESLRWAVHKPNGEELWSQLRVSVASFMQGLFRQGAFKGVSARDAYFVKCDASTTTQDDINAGVVNIVIGFAPLKPAEFVIVSLRQIVQPAA
jgi:phage tail sheath protein FI